MRIHCLFFAESKRLTGIESRDFNFEKEITSSDFFHILLLEYPALLKVADHSILAVNLEYVEKEASVILKNGDEIAFITPLSGG